MYTLSFSSTFNIILVILSFLKTRNVLEFVQHYFFYFNGLKLIKQSWTLLLTKLSGCEQVNPHKSHFLSIRWEH